MEPPADSGTHASKAKQVGAGLRSPSVSQERADSSAASPGGASSSSARAPAKPKGKAGGMRNLQAILRKASGAQ